MGIYRTLRTLNLAPTSMTRFACHWVHFHLYYAPFLEMLLLLVLVIDRTIAIVAGTFYRLLTVRQVLVSCMIALVLSLLIKLLPSYLGVRLDEVVTCLNINSPTDPVFSSYGQNLDLALALLVLVMYLAMMGYIRCRMLPKLRKAAQDTAGRAAMITVKRQMKLLPLLRRLVLIHCSLTLVAKLLLAIAPLTPAEYGLRLTAYGGMVITADLLVNAAVLITTNKEVRTATLAVLGVKSHQTVAPNVVQPVSGISPKHDKGLPVYANV